MNRRHLLQALAAIVPMLACGRKPESPMTVSASASVRASTPPSVRVPTPIEGHEMLPHPSDPTKKIEWFWKKPRGAGPFPAVVLLHGHQIGERPGGRMWVTSTKFDRMVNDGYVVAAISQPGYGESDGPPDYCGPFTQEAVVAVLRELRGRPFVDPKRVALEGGSRGAVVAGIVAARDPSLAALVLISGPYDLNHQYAELVRTNALPGIRQFIEVETAGASESALRERSVLAVADKIQTPTLILNGQEDDRTDPVKALDLANGLKGRGVFAKVVIYPNVGHMIPPVHILEEERPFLRTYLRPQ